MKRFCLFCSYVCLAAIAAVGATAHADTFNFQITDSTGGSGSGTLTAVPDASIAGAFDITGISGTYDGSPMTELACATYSPSDPCSTGSSGLDYDNLLYPSGVSSFWIENLDPEGIGFEAGGQEFEIFGSSSHQEMLQFVGENPHETILASLTVTPTPEPSSFLLLGSGLVGMAGAFRGRIRG